ncbi:MAG: hypothetical protein WCW36_02280 [Candidatus Paceibacterota bacterium]
MRPRTILFTLTLVAGSIVLPHLAHAVSIPFFGPIVPDEINQCAAGWGAVMIVVNRIIMLALSVAIVFIAPIMIAYAGFLMVVNPLDPSGISKARSILINTVAGIVVALAAWMIVDAVMAVLYNQGAEVPGGTLGTWSSLISSDGDLCLVQEAALQKLNQTDLSVAGLDASGNVAYISGKAGAVCSDANTACSSSALQAAGFTATQANVMSCIAVTESSGIPSTPPYNTVHPGSNSTACGTFQITKTTWKGAASGACSDFSNCQNAACNIQVAQALVSQNGYSDWTCKNCNSKAAACVQQYGG